MRMPLMPASALSEVTATETFPTGVIRVIYSPTGAPAKVGYDEIKDQVPGGK